MRKLLLFLALVGIGVGILIYIESQGPKRASDAGDEQRGTPVDNSGTKPVQDRDSEPDDGGPDIPRVYIEGEFETVGTERITDDNGSVRDVPKFRITSTNVQPDEKVAVTRYTAADVFLETYDAQDGGLQRTAKSKTGSFIIDLTRKPAALGDNGRIELLDLEIDQHSGFSFAPIHVTADLGEIFTETQVFHSLGDGVVIVDGTGLDGEGRDVTFDGLTGELRFDNGGEVRLLDAEGRAGTFTTRPNGRLIVQRVGEPEEGLIEAVADRGGHLEVREPDPDDPTRITDPFVLDADDVRVQGRVDSVTGISEVHRAFGTGNVTAILGRDTVRGGHVETVFNPAGVVDHLIVTDHPRFELTVLNDDGTLRELIGSGEGPLRAWTTPDGRSHFQLQGPATVRDLETGLIVNAQERLSGWTSKDGSIGEINGVGSVELIQGDSVLTTSEVIATFRAGDQGAALAKCSGATHIDFENEEGARFQVDASREIHINLAKERWTIPYARGLTGSSLAPDSFAIAAPLVRDLDWQNETFVAEDGVVWSGEFGNGTADRIVSRGPDDIEMFGTESLPAHLFYRASLEETVPILATFDAGRLRLLPGSVEAWTKVRAIITDDTNLLDPSLPTRPPLGPERSLMDLTAGHVKLGVTLVEGDPISPFDLECDDIQRLDYQHPKGRTIASSPRLVANGRFLGDGADELEDASSMDLAQMIASGGVEFDHQGEVGVKGAGQRLILTGDDQARIEVDPAQRVHASGLLPNTSIPFRVEADWIETKGDQLEASNASMEVDAPLSPMAQSESNPERPLPVTGQSTVFAEHLLANRTGLEFEGDVHIRTADQDGVSMVLRASRAAIHATDLEEIEGVPWNEALQILTADDGFRIAYGGLMRARGERLAATPEKVEMWGAPLIVENDQFWVDTNYLALDLETFMVETGPGVMRGGEGLATWALEFTELHPVLRGEDQMLVFVQPLLQEFDRTARADFASMWLHPKRWREAGRRALFGEELGTQFGPKPGPPAIFPANDLIANVFRSLEEGTLTQYARSIYLQGDVELDQRGYRTARANEIYMDLEHRRGWMKDAELAYDMVVGSDTHRVRTKSEMIVSTGAGSLHAEKATLTACSHDEPHYWIETTNLNLVPRVDGLWVVSLRNNSLKFGNGWRLPLPSIGNIALNERGGLEGIVNDDGDVTTIDGLFFGTTARFGTTIGTRGTVDAGETGKKIANLFGFHDKVRAKWKYEGAWMNSRGPLLGLGLLLREKANTSAQEEDFWLDLWARGIPDDGDDKGIFRVPTADRPSFRSWFNARGRYPFSDREWIDLVANTQTDPGVQSEFFQNEFFEYEERDTYLHWRKASGSNYLHARGLIRVDEFRTTLEELPAVGAYHGPSTVFNVFGMPVHYDASGDVARVRRRAGLVPFESPLIGIDGLADGLGERSVLRADTQHTLRMPLNTGVGSIRATPFVEGQFTAWDDSQDQAHNPTRGGLFAGVELTTSFLALRRDGSYLSISPLARVREEITVDENGTPVRFDALEDPLDGDRVEGGFRSIWRRPGDAEQLDIELTASSVKDRGHGLMDTTRGTALAHYRNVVFGMPFDVRTDTQYDFEVDRTPFSRSTVSVRPSEDLMLVTSYNHGRDQTGQALFEAAGVRLRYTIDPKWEVEAATSISLLGSESLYNAFTLRRFSHDFLWELIVDFRRGEGAGVRMNLAPLLGWTRSRLGVLDDEN